MSDLVSLVVLSFNSSETIRETLESCVSQTYSPLELIITDDGSTDETLKIVHEWLLKNPQILTKVIDSSVNAGIVANVRRGLAAAKGVWIKLVDADDVLLPACIESLVDAGHIHGADVVLSQFQAFGGGSWRGPKPLTERVLRSGALHNSILAWGGNVSPGSLIRRMALINEGLPPTEYSMLDDTPTYYHLAVRGYRFFYLEQVTVLYRIHDQQITSGKIGARTAFARDKDRFVFGLMRSRLGWWHPTFVHLAYQRLVERYGASLPGRIRTALVLVDPFALREYYINGYLDKYADRLLAFKIWKRV